MKAISLFALILMFSCKLQAQTLKKVIYQDGTQKLIGLTTSNIGKKLPGVLILPAWRGIDDEAKNAALELQKQGYVAFIADIYGEGNVPVDNAAAAKIAGKFKNEYQLYQHRIALALAQLKKSGINTDKLAVIGYCFGGTGALEAARAKFDVKGVVSIHGGLGKDTQRANEMLTAKVLIEHPADDSSVTPEHVTQLTQELNDGHADWQWITYAHTKHTFTNPSSIDYNPVMAKRAWLHTLIFLKEILK